MPGLEPSLALGSKVYSLLVWEVIPLLAYLEYFTYSFILRPYIIKNLYKFNAILVTWYIGKKNFSKHGHGGTGSSIYP